MIVVLLQGAAQRIDERWENLSGDEKVEMREGMDVKQFAPGQT